MAQKGATEFCSALPGEGMAVTSTLAEWWQAVASRTRIVTSQTAPLTGKASTGCSCRRRCSGLKVEKDMVVVSSQRLVKRKTIQEGCRAGMGSSAGSIQPNVLATSVMLYQSPALSVTFFTLTILA